MLLHNKLLAKNIFVKNKKICAINFRDQSDNCDKHQSIQNYLKSTIFESNFDLNTFKYQSIFESKYLSIKIYAQYSNQIYFNLNSGIQLKWNSFNYLIETIQAE